MTSAAHVSPSSALERVSSLCGRRVRALLICASLMHLAACGGVSLEGARGSASGADDLVTIQSPPLVDPTVAPGPGESRPFELPVVQRLTLDNGMEVVLVDRPGFPTVSARLGIHAGFASTPENVAYPALVARLLRDGTATRDAVEISRLIDRNGIDFRTNAGDEWTTLAADALATKADVVVALLAELVSEPTFPEDRVAARRDEYVGELELAVARPDFHVERTVRRVLFPEGHPFATHAPTVEDARRVARVELASVYEIFYGPDISRLVLVGDLPDDIETTVREAFSAWTNEVGMASEAPAVTFTTCNEAHVVVRPNSAQTSIVWVGPGVSVHEDGYITAMVANQVLGGGASARLFMNLREDKSYTYGAYSRLQQFDASAGFRASSNVRGEVTGEAMDEFLYEFRRFASEQLSEDDFDDAVDYLRGVFPIELQTNAQLAGRIAWLLRLGVDLSYLESYRGRVAAVEVDPAAALGADLFDPAELTIVLVGEETEVLAAARARSSRVHVYDLEGELLRTEPGEVSSTCD